MARFARLLSHLLLLVGVGVVLWLVLRLLGRTSGENNHYVWQADAWRRGHVDIPYRMIDVAHWQGKYFVPFPPFPSVLVFPLVAAFGIAPVNTLLVSLGLTGLSAGALWRVGERLSLARERRAWLTAAFLFGTGYANALTFGYSVWFFAHTVSFTCLLLALAETLNRKRGWVLGLLITASFLSRQMTGFALLPLALVVWPHRRARLELLCLFGAGVGAYLWYNALRFGSPLSTGYELLELNGALKVKAERYGLFHPAFLPFNLSYLLVQGPSLVFGGPGNISLQGSSVYGTALTLASPFLFLGVGAPPTAPFPKACFRAVGLASLLILVPTLFYYNNGYQQINCQRFTLDFIPLLVVPVALGLGRAPEWLWRGLILWSVLLNAAMLPFGTPS